MRVAGGSGWWRTITIGGLIRDGRAGGRCAGVGCGLWPRRHGSALNQGVGFVTRPSTRRTRVACRDLGAGSRCGSQFGGERGGARRTAVRAARAWLSERLRDDGPVWLLPCRFLRRKNVAEALLLTRWLRPEAWMVTTGGPSSADEESSFARLTEAGCRSGWRMRLGILAEGGGMGPTVAALQGASEVILMTSLQEGFGLPYLEAAVARRPLICRELGNIGPDLRRFGFRFPQAYREIWIDPALFDAKTERDRQAALFRKWRSGLPVACRRWVGAPAFLDGGREWRPRAVPLSRLTLTAQLEVLAQPIEKSWSAACGANPWLLDCVNALSKMGLHPSIGRRVPTDGLGESPMKNDFGSFCTAVGLRYISKRKMDL
jgi:hypothetical protein